MDPTTSFCFGTLCTLCTPLSYFKRPKAPSPLIDTMASFIPPIPVAVELRIFKNPVISFSIPSINPI